MVIMLTMAIIAVVQLSDRVPSEFVPKEDRGNFFILMNAQEGASFESNAKNLKQLEDILMPYRQSGKINRLLVRTPGFGGNAGIAIVGAADWDERDFSTFALMDEISAKLSNVPDVRAFAIMRSGISGGALADQFNLSCKAILMRTLLSGATLSLKKHQVIRGCYA